MTPKRNTNLYAFDINGVVYIGSQLQVARHAGLNRKTLQRWLKAQDPRCLPATTDTVWLHDKVVYCDHDFYLTTY
jgi:hypothetical protein